MNSRLTGDSVHIRDAVAEDADALAAMAQGLAAHEGIQSAFTREAFLRDGVEGENGQGRKAQFYVAVAASNAAEASADDNAQTIGFVMVYDGYDLTSASCGLHLGDIFVHADWRNKGVGRALLAHAFRAQTSAEWMSFTVMRGNINAKKFYRSLGAEAIDVDFMALGISRLEKL